MEHNYISEIVCLFSAICEGNKKKLNENFPSQNELNFISFSNIIKLHFWYRTAQKKSDMYNFLWLNFMLFLKTSSPRHHFPPKLKNMLHCWYTAPSTSNYDFMVKWQSYWNRWEKNTWNVVDFNILLIEVSTSLKHQTIFGDAESVYANRREWDEMQGTEENF